MKIAFMLKFNVCLLFNIILKLSQKNSTFIQTVTKNFENRNNKQIKTKIYIKNNLGSP